MKNTLYVGRNLYHRNGPTLGCITSLDESMITIELSQEIASKKVLRLPITHMGEWLFFEHDDVGQPVDTLARRPEYVQFGNEIILKARFKLQRALIKLLKDRYQFDGFHHYTDFGNFLSIMDMGKLLCRSKVKRMGLPFTDSADQDVIGQTATEVMDYVRFYYKEKTPTLFRNEGIKRLNDDPHMPIPVLLLFDEAIIEHPNVAFANGCGGSRRVNITTNVEEALAFDWSGIFERGPILTDEYQIMAYGRDVEKEAKIRKRNAEFLVPEEIGVEYIKQIVFRSEADRKRAILLLGDNPLYVVNKEKFNSNQKMERNYLENYAIYMNGVQFEITLQFHAKPQEYSHRLVLKDAHGQEELIELTDRICMESDSVHNRYTYYLTPAEGRKIARIEYFMNDIPSALWRENQHD